jgi:DhnA family fructose-bisphosphate aldolase class Ia
MQMLVKLIQIKKTAQDLDTATLSEIYINSSHIISVTDDHHANQALVNEAIQLGLFEGVQFSNILLSEGGTTRTITVVGAPSDVYGKIKKKQVLRG